jgi:cephalosporin-C deacetylase-like acetyl esterase
MLKEYGIGCLTDEHLESFDFYEVNLKAPGPCHSSNYLSIPKDASEKSLPIIITYDGYSAYPPAPVCHKDSIRLHCSHHGYKLPRPLNEYYMKLRTGVCKNYGLGNGVVNSMYDDLSDNYMVYLHLRNLQAMRFVTDPSYSGIIPRLHEVWSGEIRVSGGSMGGYQAICEAALSTILVKKSAKFELASVSANVPAFCNLAGREHGRVPGFSYYAKGMEYFDAAHLASLVNVPLTVPRVGLGDTTCPPNGICAMINNLPKATPFEVCFLQNSDHGYLPEPDVQKWFKHSV